MKSNMYLYSSTVTLFICCLLAETRAEIIPRHIDLAPRQTSSSAAAMVTSGTQGGEGGSIGGTGDTGSNGGGGVDGAAATIATATKSTTSTSQGLAGARATGDARLWAAGIGAGLVGFAGML